MITSSELTKKVYSVGQIAKLTGVSPGTINNHILQGRLAYYRLPSRHRRITREAFIDYLRDNGVYYDDTLQTKRDVIYARVSTHKQKSRGDLDRQIHNIQDYAIHHNPHDLQVITDVASGLNDNRKGFTALMDMVMRDEVDRIFIHYKDRLTRFDYNLIERVCAFHNVTIIVTGHDETQQSMQEELSEDIIAIIHSFSGKLCGMRRKVQCAIDKELSISEA